MNECKHRFDSQPVTSPIYVTLYSADIIGEPKLRFDMTGLADSVADAIVQASRFAADLKLSHGTTWFFHSIEQKCLDCEQLITFYDLQGGSPA